jgi:filamentous hemagglutinin family protein
MFHGLVMPVRSARLLLTVAWGAMMIAAAAPAQTRPTGGQVQAGDATIDSTANGLLITQGSDAAVINWDSFSVGQGGLVDFQNGDGATLNRVTGDGVSHIDGRLTATGSVYVMNGAGVVIGESGVVDVGGTFVASTLDVTNGDFMNGGNLLFAGDSAGRVVNFGRIGALGGDVALIGARVENRGTIVAEDGTAALAAGYEVLMRDAALADGQFVVRLGGEGTQALNAGRIQAAAVELRANQGNVLALAGNTDGLIRAEGIANVGGRIFLTAPGGQVRVEAPVVAPAGDVVLNADDVTLAGLIDVSSLDTPGGDITVEGRDITLTPLAALDASGTDGGLVRIGGDLQGGAVPGFGSAMDTATDVIVSAGATITADGTQGAGGDIVLWADNSMTFRGAISATGEGTAPGGFAEVSGAWLLYAGTADLRSDNGDWGELLLDPYNIVISTAPSSGMSGFTANANNSVLNAAVLTSALATANVNVFTSNNGAQAGNISINTPLNWLSNGRLTLTAANNININRPITAPNGGLLIDAGGTIQDAAAINVRLFNLIDGDWYQSGTSISDFYAYDFRFDPAVATFDRTTLMNGGEGLVSTVTDVYGLQGLASHSLLGASVFIAGEIDATGTANWNNGAGFRPIGTAANPYTGAMNGLYGYIVGLTINRPTTDNVGLIGYGEGGYILQVAMIDADITGRNNVGTFYGTSNYFQSEGIITGELSYVFATGQVTATGTGAGGLVGRLLDSDIGYSWARVDVTGVSDVGGLVGAAQFVEIAAFATGISDSYAVGNVTATGAQGVAGGLIGDLFGLGNFYELTNVNNSWASGAVSAPVAGGLVGRNNGGTGFGLYWDRQTTGQTVAVGDEAGAFTDQITGNATSLTTAQARDPSSYSTLSSFQWFFADGLRPMLYYTPSELIYEPEQLQILAARPWESATLMRNLALGDIMADPAGIWGSAGWMPIGRGEAPYEGYFDGNGHVIDGLYINRPEESDVGLFGFVWGWQGGEGSGGLGPVEGEIQNLMLTNVNITGGFATGAIVGYALDSLITQVYVTGTVRGSVDTGGLTGVSDGSTFINTASTARVVGDLHAGGLIGHSYLTTVLASYAQGNVSGSDGVGGLVGAADFGTELNQTFATGRVTGTGSVGGLVGYNSGTVTASFFDRTSTGRTNAFGTNTAGTQGVTALTTAQFQDTVGFMSRAMAVGWDFEADWAPPAAGFYPANYTIEPVVWFDGNSASRTYGAGNGGISVTGESFGGPDSYVFGPADDTLVVNGATLLAGLPRSLPVGFYLYGSQAGVTSTEGQDYRVVSSAGLTITPATLTIAPDDLTKIYGDADPTLTFDATGFVLDEDESLLTGTIRRLGGENVGTYGYGLGSLSAGSNYTLVLASGSTFSITPRALTIEADDITTIFGEPVPNLTYAIVDGQLVFNDTLTGQLIVVGGATGPGTFTIGQGTLTAGRNYTITFVPGTLTVNARPQRPQTFERSTDSYIPIDFDEDTIVDPFFPPEETRTPLGPSYTTEGTDQVVDQLQEATAYCSVIGQSEYVIDCLSERLAVIAAGLPETGDYADARAALNAAAGRLSELVAANEDTDFPANLTRSLRPDAPPSSRPLRPVREDNLAATLAAASGILAETQTQLLRSASASSESIHYQRIATAVGSTNTILLRST